jgi:cytochrome P450
LRNVLNERADIFYACFSALAEERRTRLHDDLASVLLIACVDGAPLAPLELLSYFTLLTVVGNEMPRNALSGGGLLAFIEHPIGGTVKNGPSPAQPQRKYCAGCHPCPLFKRAASADAVLHDQKIREG